MPDPNPTPETPQPTAAGRLTAEYELPDSDFDPDFAERYKAALAPVSTEPPVATPEPPVTPEPVPAKPPHSKYVLRLAQDMGYTQAEIEEASPEALEEAVVLEHRRLQEERRSLVAAPVRADSPAAPGSPAPNATPGAAQPGAANPPEPDLLGLSQSDLDELHPTIVAAFKKLGAEIQTLKGQLSGMGQREQAREREGFQRRCDRAFAAHEAVLGKGAFDELDPQGAELRRRRAVLDDVARDTSRIPFEKKIERAVQALFGAAAPESPPVAGAIPFAQPAAGVLPRDAAGKITGPRYTPEEWAAAATAQPTHRASPAKPPGKDRATDFVREQMKTRDFFAGEGVNGAPAVRDEDTIPD